MQRAMLPLYMLPLYVVKGTGPSLFGRNWLKSIRLELELIHAMESAIPPELVKVLDEHKRNSGS